MLKRLGFQKKLFIVYVTFFLSAILILISAFGVYIFRDHKEEEDRVFIQLSEDRAERIQQVVSDMHAISSQIVGNVTIQRTMLDAAYSQDNGVNYFDSHVDARNKVRMECSSINISDNSAEQIFLYRAPDVFLRYAGFENEEGDIYKVLKSEENEKLTQFGEDVNYKILPPHKSRWEKEEDAELVISLMRPLITTYYNQENIATVEVVKSYKELEKACRFENNALGFEVTVIDHATGDTIYPYNEVLESDKEFYMEQMEEDGQLRTVKKKDGEKGVIYSRAISKSNWSVLVYQPYSEYIASSMKTITMIAVLSALFIMASVLTIFQVIKKLTRPIQDLRASLDDVTFENMEIMTGKQTNDEVELLRVRFNGLLENLKISSNLLVQSRTAELQAKLNALQSQINPHFLYNSIMAICAAGQELQNQKVEKMCLELSSLFRYASEEADKSTIEKEMQYIEKYLHFMKWRYLEDLEYKLEAEGKKRIVVVPKMILQPITENCFTHGFYTIRPPYKVTVKLHYKEEYWFVEIIDNGGGFPEEVLTELKEIKLKIDEGCLSGNVGAITHNNKAIMNVYARMKLIYKEYTYFKIENCNQCGARIVLGGDYQREDESS